MSTLISNEEKISIKNAFAQQSFRDVADYDYIAARTLYKNQCFDQFLYFTQQCIEKYLKAILLFNDKKHISSSHNLEPIMQKVLEIKGIILDKDTKEFINDINGLDNVRYLSCPFWADGEILLKLDKAVFDLRIFCKNKTLLPSVNNSKNKNKLGKYYQKSGKVIFSGELERILENKSDKYKKLRENLIWKNFRYGKYIKKKFSFSNRKWGKNPIFFQSTKEWNKEAFNLLSEYIFFSKNDKKIFEKLNTQKQ